MTTNSDSETPEALGWRKRLFVGMQYFLPQIALTRLVGWLTTRETVWLKDAAIRTFVKAFSVNISEAAQPVPAGYTSLNAFFTRTLADDARPIDNAADAIVAPCDGMISQCGDIVDGKLFQAKGYRYDCATLLQDPQAARRFDGGQFMTIYLAPYDYHRVHMPLRGRITSNLHVPGALFSVNQATAAAVPRLFSRNERRVFQIEGDIAAAMVMVGALNVGSISTVWEGKLTAGSFDLPEDLDLPEQPLAAGDTVGWFNMGSTVILLLPPAHAGWQHDLGPGDVVRMGERIGTLSATS